MKKVLIIGASGFLGKELYKTFRLDKNYQVYGTYSKVPVNSFEYVDITDLKSVNSVFSKTRPDIVLITAALTNVEYCETNREETYNINVTGIRNIAMTCKKYRSKVIYVSTEYVFDGAEGPYNEESNVNPINYYGETKLLGEKIIQKEIEDHLIVRTTVVYGWDIHSKNFIMQLIKNLSDGKTMKVPMDQISSPTYCPNLSEMIKECCDKNIYGILNLVGSNIINRYNFAVEAAKILNLNKDLLIPVKTECLGQTAKRPLYAGLKVDRAAALLKNKPETLRESLFKLKEIYIKYKETTL